MAFLASKMAIEDAKWIPQTEEEKHRTGAFLGGVKSHLSPLLHVTHQILKENFRVVPSEFYNHINIFMTTSNVVNAYDLRGPTSAYGSACAAGQCSIAEGFNCIQDDDADVMIVGNADNGIHSYLLNGLNRLGALNKKYADEPEKASRPFDEDRGGFVAADGSGVLVLEEYEHAIKRNAKIYAELKSISLCTESYHPTRPHLEGDGIFRTMKTVIERAGIKPEDVGIIHSHGTATTEGDSAEATAIGRLFPEPGPMIMGIKSNMGHMMAGVGGIQSAALILSLKHGIVPPILNLKNPLKIGNRVLDYVADKPREKEVRFGITNNAGFGGLNCSLLFEKYYLR